MNLGDLLNLTLLKLGEQTAFYPPEEVLRSGINPAQRLLCLAYPLLLQGRVATIVTTDHPFVDLRTLTASPQIRQVRRVVIGDVTSEPVTPSPATGDLTHLRPISLSSLMYAFNDWMLRKGEVRRYWLWGNLWLGLYKRPVADTTITIIYDKIPTPLVYGENTSVPDVDEVYHAAIADIASGLLLMKEGVPDGERGLQRIQHSLQLQGGQAA